MKVFDWILNKSERLSFSSECIEGNNEYSIECKIGTNMKDRVVSISFRFV